MDEFISPEYREQNRMLHQSSIDKGQPWGMSGWRYTKDMAEFAAQIGAQSVLDYGCGSGTLKIGSEREGFKTELREYDPAIPGKDTLPGPADLVCCTDVMEHIEPDRIHAVLQHIMELATKGVYIVIATNDSHHMLPDGRSSHLTVKPSQWWIPIVAEHGCIVKIEDLPKKVKLWLMK